MKTNNIILVNKADQKIGAGEKMEVHKKGLLHRAFSIFIFNSKNELLLQQRALHKYHSGGLWSNTCCSHPKPGEDTTKAAHKRLVEEMGFDCPIEEKFSFKYKTNFGDLYEHECDHVFIGYWEKDPRINKEEVANYKWMKLSDIEEDMKKNPNNYSYWFKIAFPRLLKSLKNKKSFLFKLKTLLRNNK